MIITILVSSTIIILVLLAYVKIEAMTRDFAARHPEFGPHRERHGGCCGACPEETCHNHQDEKGN